MIEQPEAPIICRATSDGCRRAIGAEYHRGWPHGKRDMDWMAARHVISLSGGVNAVATDVVN